MPLVLMRAMLNKANDEGYSSLKFNLVYDRAAEKKQSPVISGVSGNAPKYSGIYNAVVSMVRLELFKKA
ncbi:hypothetical protein [Alkalibacillus silvisoli]|uniref:Uncharacterized protein n=1 Tax=Alkalibacillus silvisoli TaxID=392823 RepID=A0ABN1A6R8_9BACI